MQFNTFLFGNIDIGPTAILAFPQALPGFPASRRFTLVHEPADGEPASFTLQSLDEPEVALQIVDPTVFGFHYELVLTPDERELLQADNTDDVAVMLALLRREGALSANLHAPILLNTKTKRGMQKVLPAAQERLPKACLLAA